MSRSRHVTYKDTQKNVQVDIIIPVHRRIDLLEACLNRIPEAFDGTAYHVTLFDNGTPHSEKANLYANLKTDPKFTIIESPENIGFPRACNKAAHRCTAPLFFFLNSDILLDPGSGNVLVETMKDESIGVVGMKLVFPMDLKNLNPKIRRPGTIQHVGLMTTIRGDIAHALIGWDEYHPKVMAIREVLGVTGAALMTRRSLWLKIGGFYEGYGLGTFEDIDYCMRARELNHNVVVEVNARAEHYTGATAETYNLSYPLQMNKIIFMQRWMGRLPWTEYTCW